MNTKQAAAILAGGESRRFGADKALAMLGGVPLIERVANAIRGPGRKLAVVGHPSGAALLNCVTLHDPAGAVGGPLAGVLAALDWAAAEGAEWLVTAPCDAPLIPADMAERLIESAELAGARAAFATTPSGLHPLCAAWSPSLAGELRKHFERGVHPPVREIVPEAPRVLFADEDAFMNINTPADLAFAEARVGKG